MRNNERYQVENLVNGKIIDISVTKIILNMLVTNRNNQFSILSVPRPQIAFQLSLPTLIVSRTNTVDHDPDNISPLFPPTL